MIQRRDAHGIRDEQVHGTIESTVDREIPRQWRHILAMRVIHAHAQQVALAEAQFRSQLETECGEPAAMLAELLSVEVDVGDEGGRFEADEQAPALPRLGNVEVACIPGRTAVIAVRQIRIGGLAVLAVKRVPRVWDRDVFPSRRGCVRRDVGPEELPTVGENDVGA